MHRRAIIAILISPALWSVAHAEGRQRLAVLMPIVEPKPAIEIAERFHAAAIAGIHDAGFDVAKPEQLKAHGLTDNPCAAAACASDAARTLGVEGVVTVKVSVVGKNYTSSAVLYAGQALISQAEKRCEICTLKEATDSCRAAAKAAVSDSSDALAAIPPAASSPNSDKAQPAPAIVPSVHQTAPPTKQAEADGAKLRWPLWPSLVGAGAAVVALSIGIPLLAVDGTGTKCRGEPRDDYRNCSRIYQTGGAGWVMTTMGLAALTAAGVLFYLYWNGAKEDGDAKSASRSMRYLSLFPTSGGMGAAAGYAF